MQALRYWKARLRASPLRHVSSRRAFNHALACLRGGGRLLNRTLLPEEHALLTRRNHVTLFHITLEPSDLDRVRATTGPETGRYLNDNSMDVWMKLLMRRSYRHGGSDYFFTTQLYRKLLDGDSVRRWTVPRVVGGMLQPARPFRVPMNCSGLTSIWQARRLFIPANLGNNHWVLVVVTLSGNGQGLECYDSGRRYGHNVQATLELIRTWLQTEFAQTSAVIRTWLQTEFAQTSAVLALEEPNLASWPTSLPVTPQQPNDYDCGVFVCMIADLLSNNELLPTRVQDPWLQAMRRRMAVRLQQGEDSLQQEAADLVDLTTPDLVDLT